MNCSAESMTNNSKIWCYFLSSKLKTFVRHSHSNNQRQQYSYKENHEIKFQIYLYKCYLLLFKFVPVFTCSQSIPWAFHYSFYCFYWLTLYLIIYLSKETALIRCWTIAFEDIYSSCGSHTIIPALSIRRTALCLFHLGSYLEGTKLFLGLGFACCKWGK